MSRDERAWGTIRKIKDSDGIVKGPVIEVVKGGLIVDIGLRGFLPASLVEFPRSRGIRAIQSHFPNPRHALGLRQDIGEDQNMAKHRAGMSLARLETLDRVMTERYVDSAAS